jgi:hypothetical protein
MCFSATASFTVGISLMVAGAYSFITAHNHHKKYMLLSLVPLFFGLQQCLEGLVWLSLSADRLALTQFVGQLYLFFAFFLWPSYLPLSIYPIETNLGRKKILRYFIIAGGSLGLALYLPILLHMTPLPISSTHHSISYGVYQASPDLRTYATLCYAFISIFPLFLSTQRKIQLLGVLALLSFLAAYWWLIYAFTSVWCFFVAVLSVYIVHVVRSSPRTA